MAEFLFVCSFATYLPHQQCFPYIHISAFNENKIKATIYESGHSLNEVAQKLGISSTNLSNMLARRSIRYSLAKEIAQAIGYDLRFQKTNKP